MERKHSVWLIVLLVLLVAALGGVIMVKSQWDASKVALVNINDRLARELEYTKQLADQLSEQEDLLAEQETQLTEKDALLAEQDALIAEKDDLLAEQEQQLTAKAEPDASVAPAKTAAPVESAESAETTAPVESTAPAETAAPVETAESAETTAPVETTEAVAADASSEREALVTGLDKILLQLAEISADETATAEDNLAELDQIGSALSDYAEQLTDALDASNAENAGLAAELEAANATIEQLNAQIEQNMSDVTALETQMTEAADDAALADQITAEKQSTDELTAQLQTALAEYGNALSELRLYKLEHDPEAGDYCAATALSGDVSVAADGVTATIDVSNSILSANTLTVELLLNDEVIAVSEELAPGEALASLTLSKPLAAGEYEAIAALNVRSAEGETLFRQRMPVKLTVAE